VTLVSQCMKYCTLGSNECIVWYL